MAPEAGDVYGNDGRVESVDDAFKAALEGLGMAGAGDEAFGEDGYEFAGFNGGASLAKGVDGVLRRFRVDGYGVEEVEEEPDDGCVVNGTPDEEAGDAGSALADEDGIGIGDVVGDEKRAAGAGELMIACGGDACPRKRP